jgi:phosphopantetheine adenylyltransferase
MTMQQSLPVNEIEYGATFNLGDYNSERISIRVAIEPGETLEAAAARARAFVEGMHADTVARRKRAQAMQHAQDRVENLRYQVERARRDASALGLAAVFDALPKPETDDELELLMWEIDALNVERKALQTAHDEQHQKQREQERQRRVEETANGDLSF